MPNRLTILRGPLARPHDRRRGAAWHAFRGAAALAVAAVSILAGACASSQAHAGDAGHDGAADAPDPRTAICASPNAAAPPYALVQQIFDLHCTSCHGTSGPEVVLVDGVAWNNLVGKAPPPNESCGGTLVVAGDPGASYLYQKLTTASPCYGAQMPYAEFNPVPLPTCVTDIVGAWIREGAPGPGGDASTD